MFFKYFLVPSLCRQGTSASNIDLPLLHKTITNLPYWLLVPNVSYLSILKHGSLARSSLYYVCLLYLYEDVYAQKKELKKNNFWACWLLITLLHYRYIIIYKCICVYAHVCMYLCVYICIYVCVYVYIYMCIYMHMHVYVCIYMCMCVCMCIYINICYIYTYIYIYIDR